jgi:hypothetical protein
VLFRQVKEAFAILPCGRQWLLAVNVFPCRERRGGYFRMSQMRGKVNHQFHILIGCDFLQIVIDTAAVLPHKVFRPT